MRQRTQKPAYKTTRTTRSQTERTSNRKAIDRPYRKPWRIGQGLKAPKHLRERGQPLPKLSLAIDDVQTRAFEKLLWIQAFVNAGCPYGQLLPLARARAAVMASPQPIPPYTTLRHWVECYVAYGLRGLVDAPGGRRLGKRTKPSEKAPLTGHECQVVEQTALANEPVSVIARLAARGDATRAKAIYPVVRRLRQTIRAAQPHAVVMAAEGPAGHRQRNQLSIPQVPLPDGRCLAIDSTTMDLWLQIPTADALKVEAVRPTITMVSDEGSRRLITFGVFLTPVDADILHGLMARAFVPGRNWKGLPTVPVPAEMNVDHGSEHHAAFREAMERLGVRWVPRSAYAPKGGARVERLHETLQTSLLAHTIGYSPRQQPLDDAKPCVDNPERKLSGLKYERFRLEVSKTELLSLAEVEELVRAWAVRYNATPHPALTLDRCQLSRAVG